MASVKACARLFHPASVYLALGRFGHALHHFRVMVPAPFHVAGSSLLLREQRGQCFFLAHDPHHVARPEHAVGIRLLQHAVG